MSRIKEIDNHDDVIDVRDIIEIIEADEDNAPPELIALMDELAGYGGDEEWRGDWYPITLIHEAYWIDYVQQFAEDIGAVNTDSTWPNNCIDWDKAARELAMDYGQADFDGQTYYYR